MAEIVRYIVKGRLAGVVATRNMFTGDANLVAPDSHGTLASGYLSRMFSPFLNYISTIWTTETIQTQKYVAGVWEDFSEDVWAISGNATGDALPNAVAMVLIGKAGGRNGHGRKFLAGLAESALSGNTLVSAALAAAATTLGYYITSYTTPAGSTFAPGIVDKNGNFHIFLTGFVSSLIGSMRRRKPGLGI